MDNIQHNQNPCVQEFGISIENYFEEVNARILNPPIINYSKEQTAQVKDGVW